MEAIKVGLIGYGYWGPNLARNFFESDDYWLTSVCDKDEAKFSMLKKRYPTIRMSTNISDILDDETIDVVAIATPVFTHFELAMAAMKRGKHVFVEKPMAASVREASEMVAEAEKQGVKLMVDHIFVYTEAVKMIKQMMENDSLGKINYYDSVRVNLGLFQSDVNVVWDLAVHDLSILDYLFDSLPVAVSATGMAHVNSRKENIAYVTLFYGDNTMAHIHVNWLSPVKIRRTLLGGEKQMLLYDDLEPSEKIKVFDKGLILEENPKDVYKMKVGYRLGDIWMPKVDNTEAIKTGITHFVDCIKNNKNCLSGGESGLRVLKVMEAIDASILEQGKRIKIK